jgi:GxxExxY protein
VQVADDRITGKILRCALKVSRTLGVGFIEKVYENALMVELRQNGLKAAQQVSVKVYYANEVVGVYVSDLIVENEVIIELKCVKEIEGVHQAQLLNYLRATGLKRA